MPGHYILIDAHSGYIWADTRDLAGYRNSDHGPADAARLLAEQGLTDAGEWSERGFNHSHDGAEVFFVYRVDVDGSESVPVVTDGQDQETIDAVLASCRPDCQLTRA